MRMRRPIRSIHFPGCLTGSGRTFFVAAFLSLAMAACEPSAKWVQVRSDLSYPESPVVSENRLFFVEYSAHRIASISLTGKDHRIVFQEDGCGPAAFAFLVGGQAVVSCYDANEVLLLDTRNESWKIIARIGRDRQGNALEGPNDFAANDDGGVFFTTSGKFSPDAEPGGRVYYWRPGSEPPELLRQGLRFANGIAVSERRLWVSEHFNNRLLGFPRDRADGILDGQAIVDLPARNEAPVPGLDGKSMKKYLGPDGLHLGKEPGKGSELFVAHFGAGEVLRLKLNQDGYLVQEEAISLPGELHYPTNVTFHEGSLFVTALRDAFSPPYEGELLRMELR